MNNFYASVECMLDPSLRGRPVAVAGDSENRHGIVLAKNYEAKRFNIQTGDVIWQAMGKCPDLVIVPPHYDLYLKYSRVAREIYAEYTDLVEPYGLDECWLDVSGSRRLFGSGEKIANEIRRKMKYDVGLTISVGVSFNKTFAKLGSDMKKPDAVTVITREGFRDKVWGLPASAMMGVGRATERALTSFGIRTIGDLAAAPPEIIGRRLGKCGLVCIDHANGRDPSPVMPADCRAPVKSVGHGITAREDLENNADVWRIMLSLTQEIGRRLRVYGLYAGGVQIAVRNDQLFTRQWQAPLEVRTNSSAAIAKGAYELFARSYGWDRPIRSLSVRAINLDGAGGADQIDVFGRAVSVLRREKLESVVDVIQERYGRYSVVPALLVDPDPKMPTDRDKEESYVVTLPTGVY